MAKWAGKIATELCKAMGLEVSDISRLVIDCKAGDIARVDIYQYLAEKDAIKEVLSHYKLVPLDKEDEL